MMTADDWYALFAWTIIVSLVTLVLIAGVWWADRRAHRNEQRQQERQRRLCLRQTAWDRLRDTDDWWT